MRIPFMSSRFVLLFSFAASVVSLAATKDSNVISYVDTSLQGAQKFVLRVAGRPFFPVNVQVRVDKLRYFWGWDATAREAIFARAAADGFNTVALPVHWYEVEPGKDQFKWDILDEYLSAAQKHGLKIEILWFGQNSGGHVQWLGDPKTDPVHLRVPDYVLFSPGPDSTETKSDYTIRREMSPYSLDLADDRLKEREAYVLQHVMNHVADWDAANGSKHPVVGVQLGNEVLGMKGRFPPSLVISYLSRLGGAVKQSRYSTWTRVNCVYMQVVANATANETLRAAEGTNIDFVGIDTYRHHFRTDRQFIESMRTNVPEVGKNYKMIMEANGSIPVSPILPVAALAGNSAFTYYEMLGPDNYGLYDRDGATGFKPHGDYVEDARTVNRLFVGANADLARNANGAGLFVHNWTGDSVAPTTSVDGIAFVPSSADSQAISIKRGKNEFVLLNTKGGTFTVPASLELKHASRGRFDQDDKWIAEGEIAWAKGTIAAPAGTILRLTR
jgi:hypothetical protein